MLFDLFYSCVSANYGTKNDPCDYSLKLCQDKLFVFFKSSDGLYDWLNNFDFPAKASCASGEKWYCHRGFLRSWKNISDSLCEKVDNVLMRQKNVKELICVGYSHGASLCLFAFERFSYLYKNRLKVIAYGFGAPRVVFGFLSKKLKHRLRNFIVIRNVPAIVTHLPPAFLFYRHVGRVLNVGKSGNFSPVSAHKPNAYLQSLKELKTD